MKCQLIRVNETSISTYNDSISLLVAHQVWKYPPVASSGLGGRVFAQRVQTTPVLSILMLCITGGSEQALLLLSVTQQPLAQLPCSTSSSSAQHHNDLRASGSHPQKLGAQQRWEQISYNSPGRYSHAAHLSVR